MTDEETKSSELVIIRRGGGGEEGKHHGGVWKIAYADFMTAMMAFFLVMWLINSTDKKTLTQVATYFNPLRLTDKVPTTKGLHQAETGAQGSQNEEGSGKTKADRKSEPRAEGRNPHFTEDALFQDPMGVLDKLAKQAAGEREQTNSGAQGDSGRLANGEAYRDPFDPAFRRETQAGASAAAKVSAPGANDRKQPDVAPVSPSPPGRKSDAAEAQPVQAAQPASAPAEPPSQTEAQARPEQAAQAPQAAERAKAAKLETDIKDLVARYLKGAIPHIEVTVTEEGLLISVTDDYNFGMFAIASAEPRPAMVLVMEKLAKILTTQPEPLIVRGHTDGRPYKSGTYDNWRLSTARAHMAYYMLVRGGVDEKRFERVEGYADRSLRVPADPEAAQNRRIELLLRKPKP
jgi:chemotaxis protein MotB